MKDRALDWEDIIADETEKKMKAEEYKPIMLDEGRHILKVVQVLVSTKEATDEMPEYTQMTFRCQSVDEKKATVFITLKLLDSNKKRIAQFMMSCGLIKKGGVAKLNKLDDCENKYCYAYIVPNGLYNNVKYFIPWDDDDFAKARAESSAYQAEADAWQASDDGDMPF